MLELYNELTRLLTSGGQGMLVTIIRASGSAPRGAGTQMLVGENGILCGTVGGGNVEYLAVSYAKELLPEKRSDVRDYALRFSATESIGMVCGGDVTLLFSYAAGEVWRDTAKQVSDRLYLGMQGFFILPLDGSPPALADTPCDSETCFSLRLLVKERVVIFGGGHIARSLVPLLDSIGFRVTVFENRREYVTEERFPAAEKLILGDYLKPFDYFTPEADDYYVVMTNGHLHDFEVQRSLLRGQFAYLGVVGSKKKKEAVNAMLLEEGISPEAVSAVHTPVGLPIRAATPAEIAVSIAAEMISVRASRRAGDKEELQLCPMHR